MQPFNKNNQAGVHSNFDAACCLFIRSPQISPIMNEKELSNLITAGIIIKNDMSIGIRPMTTASILTTGILALNYAIDKMGNNKNEHYYSLIECCHSYYRMLDEFLY